MKIIFFSFVALAVAIGTAWLHAKSRKAKSMKLQERHIMDDNALYLRYYADSGIPQARVQELWHEVANALRVSPGLLRPEEQLGKDIGTWSITSEDLDYLSQLAIKRAKVDGKSIDLQAIKCVDDYVRALG
nr:MAG TPA: hypothetical protein [Inoviridae sp.]